MYYMLVRLSVCLNHIKGTIIIISSRDLWKTWSKLYGAWKTGHLSTSSIVVSTGETKLPEKLDAEEVCQ